MTDLDAVKCGCDEFPECTHALYFYEGAKHAESQMAKQTAARREKLRAELCFFLNGPPDGPLDLEVMADRIMEIFDR